MRVTDSMLRTHGVQSVQFAMRKVAEYQEQLSSGKRINRISDDPIAAQSVMRARNRVASIDQFQTNILAVRNRQTLEESVINELASIIEDARQIGLTEGSDTRNADTRAASANIVDAMITHVIALGNSRVGSDYIFGGTRVDQPAFDATGVYQGDTNLWEVEIDKNFRVAPNLTGQRIFVDSGLITALQDLRTALTSNDADGILSSTEDLRLAFEDMQNILADTGGRAQVVDASEHLHQVAEDQVITHMTAVEAVDMAEAASLLAASQATLQASLLALRSGMNLDIASLLG